MHICSLEWVYAFPAVLKICLQISQGHDMICIVFTWFSRFDLIWNFSDRCCILLILFGWCECRFLFRVWKFLVHILHIDDVSFRWNVLTCLLRYSFLWNVFGQSRHSWWSSLANVSFEELSGLILVELMEFLSYFWWNESKRMYMTCT